VSLATVRTQLKSVFAKTNTHRQAEVIQLLLVALLL
jgi:DNA-binding CsgD family transcriptional regulator